MRTALALGACVLAAVGCAPKHAPAHVGRAVEKSGAVEGSPPVSAVPDSTSTTMARATTTTTKAVRRTRKRPTQLAPVVHEVWWSLALCESGGRPATNTGNGYYGAFQFALGTWRSVGESGLPSDHSYAHQLAAARRLQARSGWGQWPFCARKLGLG